MRFKVGDVVRLRESARVYRTFDSPTDVYVELRTAIKGCYWWPAAQLEKVQAAKKKLKAVPAGRGRK